MMTEPQMIPAFVDGTLRPVEKLEVHRKGLRHLAVSVFVLRGGQVLLQQRALGKYHTPGLWANACCTHPLWGEAAEDCARRRLEEELGLSGLALRHAGQVEYRAAVPPDMIEHELVEIFVAEAAPGQTPQPNPEEVAAVEWLSRPALDQALASQPDRFTPWLQIYMDRHAGLIFGSPITA